MVRQDPVLIALYAHKHIDWIKFCHQFGMIEPKLNRREWRECNQSKKVKGKLSPLHPVLHTIRWPSGSVVLQIVRLFEIFPLFLFGRFVWPTNGWYHQPLTRRNPAQWYFFQKSGMEYLKLCVHMVPNDDGREPRSDDYIISEQKVPDELTSSECFIMLKVIVRRRGEERYWFVLSPRVSPFSPG